VIAASEDVSSAAAQLFRRARAGDFDIAVSTRVPFQLTKPLADSDLATYIAGVRVLGSPARWGDATSGVSPSVWGGGDM
jgi:hypothetical protein